MLPKAVMSLWMIRQDHAAVRTVQLFVVQNLNPLHCLFHGFCLVWMLCMSSCGSPTWDFCLYFLHWFLESGVTGKVFKMPSSESHLPFSGKLHLPRTECLCLYFFHPAKSSVLWQVLILMGSVLAPKNTH